MNMKVVRIVLAVIFVALAIAETFSMTSATVANDAAVLLFYLISAYAVATSHDVLLVVFGSLRGALMSLSSLLMINSSSTDEELTHLKIRVWVGLGIVALSALWGLLIRYLNIKKLQQKS